VVSRELGTAMAGLARSLAVRSSSMYAAALVVALALGACGCTTAPDIQAGRAFAPDYRTSIGSAAIRPGTEMGWLYLYLKDTSKSALVINSVDLSGPGVGNVTRAVEVKIAPLRSGYHHIHGKDATPGGLYMTEPPVNLAESCHKQALSPLDGYRMTPGSQARVYIVLRALRPGRYSVRRWVLHYTQRGVEFQQTFPYRFWGEVAENAPRTRIDPAEAICVRPTGARVLAGWRLPEKWASWCSKRPAGRC
jgi:hypothetical protein